MSYVGTSSEGYSDHECECPKTPLHRYPLFLFRPLRGYENILEDFEDEPMYVQTQIRPVKVKAERKVKKPMKSKKSIF